MGLPRTQGGSGQNSNIQMTKTIYFEHLII